MDNEQRKAEIRRGLKLSKYPRRANAVFTDENDHNPFILEDCPNCHGQGEVDIYRPQDDGGYYLLDECPVCSGSGTTEEIVRYHDNSPGNDAPIIDVKTNSEGWIKCPCCSWRFTIKDPEVWTGSRHKRCGQRLNVL